MVFTKLPQAMRDGIFRRRCAMARQASFRYRGGRHQPRAPELWTLGIYL